MAKPGVPWGAGGTGKEVGLLGEAPGVGGDRDRAREVAGVHQLKSGCISKSKWMPKGESGGRRQGMGRREALGLRMGAGEAGLFGDKGLVMLPAG